MLNSSKISELEKSTAVLASRVDEHHRWVERQQTAGNPHAMYGGRRMTALGIDISEHNPGLIIPTDGSVDYVIARASLAETKKDTLYRSFHDQCKAAKIPFAAYHFVYPRLPGSSYDAQAQNFHSVVGDTSIPVMLDVETDNTTHPSLADAVGVHR